MAIPVSASGGGNFETIKPDNYVAVCYEMIHIGTVPEEYMGVAKMQNKVRISWELSNELKVWKDGEDPRPAVISKEYTLHLGETANLRKMLVSWRGVDFSPAELEKFDLEKLVGAACMLNVTEKTSKNGKTYNDVASVSKLPKEITKPKMISEKRVLSYDNFDLALFNSLPDFIKDKIKTSVEYKAMSNPHVTDLGAAADEDQNDELPF